MPLCLPVSLPLFKWRSIFGQAPNIDFNFQERHTYIHHTHTYIFVYRNRKRKREREREMAQVDRRIGVAVDFSACSLKALKWAVDNVVRDGDSLILVAVRPEGNYEEGEMQLWKTTGSRNSLWSLCSSLLCLSVCLFVLTFKSSESSDMNRKIMKALKVKK